MTLPANPAGQYRQRMKVAIQHWIEAQNIEGINAIVINGGPDLPWDDYPDSGNTAVCIVRVRMPRRVETRGAQTGPINRGGKDLHYSVELEVTHRGFDVDEGGEESEVDYDRIVDALIDSIRGVGRDLGEPELVLQVGEWPAAAGIIDEHEDPFETDGSAIERAGTISFTLSQYLPTDVP
jgi:hypothetical protein